MPPIFAYLLLLTIWVFFACLVWLTAGLMYLTTRTRIFSRPLCFAMAGTFPFVFIYQIIAAPFVAALLLAAFGICNILEPGSSTTTHNPLVIVVSITAALLSFGTMLTMSIAGFYEGWRTGWACADGRRFQGVLYEGYTVRLLRQFLQRARLVVSPLSVPKR
jgi:hypothetical protein